MSWWALSGGGGGGLNSVDALQALSGFISSSVYDVMNITLLRFFFLLIRCATALIVHASATLPRSNAWFVSGSLVIVVMMVYPVQKAVQGKSTDNMHRIQRHSLSLIQLQRNYSSAILATLNCY